MEEWIPVCSQEDIERLLAAYAGFHDSCLAELHYQSGTGVDADRAMHFSGPEERVLTAVFHSQWAGKLALRFSGVRRFCAAGWQEQYNSEILGCYLAIHTGLIAGREEPLIVWSDNGAFSPTREGRPLLAEPMDTVIIASRLEWMRLM